MVAINLYPLYYPGEKEIELILEIVETLSKKSHLITPIQLPLKTLKNSSEPDINQKLEKIIRHLKLIKEKFEFPTILTPPSELYKYPVKIDPTLVVEVEESIFRTIRELVIHTRLMSHQVPQRICFYEQELFNFDPGTVYNYTNALQKAIEITFKISLKKFNYGGRIFPETGLSLNLLPNNTAETRPTFRYFSSVQGEEPQNPFERLQDWQTVQNSSASSESEYDYYQRLEAYQGDEEAMWLAEHGTSEELEDSSSDDQVRSFRNDITPPYPASRNCYLSFLRIPQPTVYKREAEYANDTSTLKDESSDDEFLIPPELFDGAD